MNSFDAEGVQALVSGKVEAMSPGGLSDNGDPLSFNRPTTGEIQGLSIFSGATTGVIFGPTVGAWTMWGVSTSLSLISKDPISLPPVKIRGPAGQVFFNIDWFYPTSCY